MNPFNHFHLEKAKKDWEDLQMPVFTTKVSPTYGIGKILDNFGLKFKRQFLRNLFDKKASSLT